MGRKTNFETRITIVYLILGVLWILITDILVKYFISDLDKSSQFQSIKGILFVIISSGVIYFVAQHYNSRQKIIKQRLIKARKKAENNERLKTAFLANLSHEIRTPMNGILGFVSLLKEPDFHKEMHQSYLNYVKISSERMLETLNDIIEISQIESNQIEIQNSEFNLHEMINKLYVSFLPAAEDKGLNFDLDIKLPEASYSLKTDKSKLESILKNFIRNAIKFSSSGTIVLGVKIENGEIVFFVKDNGIGIPQNMQKKIFDRFVQADSTITRPYEGSGLGLAIAKAYGGLLGGKIWLESEEAKGSTFWFSIPQSSLE